MEFFKKLFNMGRKAVHIPTRYEKIELDRLARHEVYCEDKDKVLYIHSKGELIRVKVIGKYSYYDVDGQVSNIIAQKDNGEIIGIWRTITFVRKPHDWVLSLSAANLWAYSRSQDRTSDSDLEARFYKELDVATKRDMKLERLLK